MRNPLVLDSPDAAPDWTKVDTRVVKIVVGQLPGGQDAKPIKLDALPDDFAALFPHLTHLYLWQIEGLKHLPSLRAGLRCLDVRGCAELGELPALPAELELLDLGGCKSLASLPAAPARLQRFYFNDCTSIEDFEIQTFLKMLERAPLVEIDGSRSPLASLKKMPRQALRRLVLAGCEKLTDVKGLETFPALEYLDLSGCTALKALPNLPLFQHPRPPCLFLHGAENLTDFMGQSVGPYDRGGEKHNVAPAFVSRRKFGEELAIMPHAKLLLMGNGRVGKSTLAKRLQWEEMDDAARRAKPEAEPKEKNPGERQEDPTHAVRFLKWETGLALQENEIAELDQRARAAGLTLPKTPAGLLSGAVRLWDFGGQEIYHHTHRIFAGEGSVFLLVWRETPPSIIQPPPNVTQEEWEAINRHRPVDYWLDYIYSIRENAQVALVCAGCKNPDAMKHKPDWQAGSKYGDRDLPCFFVDSTAPDCGAHKQFLKLQAWIRKACAEEAWRIGILQPAFYKQVSDLAEMWEKSTDLDAESKRLLSWANWKSEVIRGYRPPDRDPEQTVEENDVASITGYLHDAGHVFEIRDPKHRAVVISQEWAASLIYELLKPGGLFRRLVQRRGGWFYRDDLTRTDQWKARDNDAQRERLLAYMEECQVITRIGRSEPESSGRDIYLASDEWLLPPFEEVESELNRQITDIQAQPGIRKESLFEDGETLEISEPDFRALQACLARTFATRALYFRTGLQAVDADGRWLFRMQWIPADAEKFAGRIRASIFAKESAIRALAREMEGLFFQAGSLLEGRARKELGPLQGEGEMARAQTGAPHVKVACEHPGASRPLPEGPADAEILVRKEGIRSRDAVRDSTLPVVVLLTVNDHETDAVLDAFLGPGQPPSIETTERLTYYDHGPHGGVRVIHVITRMGSGSIGAAQQRTLEAIADWKPQAVIGAGIAFGIDETKQTIGDVLVAEQIQDYELGRLGPDGTLQPRGDKPSSADKLFNRLKMTDGRERRARPDDWPKVHFGLVLSGSKLVDNIDYRTSLKALFPEAIGGEMEAFGIYVSAAACKVDWIVIKGICDWAHDKNSAKKEEWQKLAARNAAQVLRVALDVGGLYEAKEGAAATAAADSFDKKQNRRITNVPAASQEAMAGIPNEMPRGAVFVSYSRDDFPAAANLVRGLAAAGIPVWLDKQRLEAGENFEHSVERAVRLDCSFFLSVISRVTESDPSRFVHRERSWAAQRHVDGYIFYLPIIIDDTAIPKLEPPVFRSIHFERFPGGEVSPDFARRLARLVEEWRRSGQPRD